MDYLGKAQSGSARGGRAWRRPGRSAAAADHRGRGLGQDRHAGASRRASGDERRRPAPHPAADVLAPRRRRDGARAPSASSTARAARTRAPACIWAGTFHAIGARFLREYAERIGLDRAFTIHDREDAADLMNLVRHELGFSHTESRFPAKGTCLSIYSRAVNAEAPLEEVLGKAFPWCANWATELKKLFAAYVEAKQRQNVLDYDDLLLYWAHMLAEHGVRRRDRRALRPRPGRRISGHQPPAGLDPAGAEAGRARDDGGRRRRAVDLFVPRRDRAQHSRFSRSLHAAGARRHARAELSLDAADPRGLERRDRARGRALHQEPVVASAKPRSARC